MLLWGDAAVEKLGRLLGNGAGHSNEKQQERKINMGSCHDRAPTI